MVPWVECSNPNGSSDWSCEAQVEVRVFNHMNNSFAKESVDLEFTDDEQLHAIDWSDVNDPNNGYLKVTHHLLSCSQVFSPSRSLLQVIFLKSCTYQIY